MPDHPQPKSRYLLVAAALCAGIAALYHVVEMASVDEAHFPRGWEGDFRYASRSTYVVVSLVEAALYFCVAIVLWKSVRMGWVQYGLMLLVCCTLGCIFCERVSGHALRIEEQTDIISRRATDSHRRSVLGTRKGSEMVRGNADSIVALL